MQKHRPLLSGNLQLSSPQGVAVSARRIALLEAIDTQGSIAAAAKQLGISYRSAWDAVADINNLWDGPLVEKTPGGARGGGTRLTPRARELIENFKLMQQEYQRYIDGLSRLITDFSHFQQTIRRLSMRTSARNQYQGKVVTISEGPINTEVTLALNDQDRLTAIVTRESAESLGLSLGSEVYALIKASFIILTLENEHCASSARNRLCGRVRELRHGPVSSEVIIELEGGKSLAAVITEESTKNLGLIEGSRVCALIKASHVILGID